jgi:cytochrome bd-type quinol oxidase subunit 1
MLEEYVKVHKQVIQMAQRYYLDDAHPPWTKAFALLFVSGAVSGTILSFEIGLLWPTFTKFSGAIIGLPFALEGFAFFIEAIFLGLYLYGWERLSPRAHWLCSFPLWIRCKLLPMTLLMALS